MFIGPVFSREVAITPRRTKFFAGRTAYGLSLLLLVFTSWMVLTGTQLVRDVGDLARFGTILFQILAPLQLAMAVFFSAMLAASAVAQEKDRKTLLLLLLTRLTNSELVLGKLLASVLYVLVMLAAAFPIFMLTALLGGVSFGQIARAFAVTLASVLACGSLGSVLALWREKTYQALAMTVLILVLWFAAWEIVAAGAFGPSLLGISCQSFAAWFSPWQAILAASRPFVQTDPTLGPFGTPVYLFLVVALSMSILLNGIAIAMVRVWNPSREARPMQQEEDSPGKESIWGAEHDAEHDAGAATVSERGAEALPTRSVAAAGARPSSSREVWDNPILWREMRTWAYGRKILVIKLVYLLLFGLAATALVWMVQNNLLSEYAGGTIALVPLLLLSLVLVNAQAVTSMTSERDTKALDLLLVTDLTPKEVVFGKLGGVFYNTKEMIALPMLLCIYLWLADAYSFENLIYILLGLAVMYVFVGMLGVHAGMTYGNSQAAIATSLGTVFFLFVGVATTMRMMVAFSGSFEGQMQSFLAVMIGGGVGLYVSLGVRNPSNAIALASFLCPFATFYAITSFLLGQSLGVFLVVVAAYGFTTAAMMVPAIYEFDVATGRTTVDET